MIGEQTGFTKIAGELTRTQTLFSPWTGATVALKGLVTGQWSGVVLPAVEKFYLGGLVYTRGYYSGEVTGDKAVAATAGGGVGLSFTPNTEFDLWALTRFTTQPLGTSANVTPLKEDAIYWRVLVRF